ncbi:hypothetical protein IMG5_181290 [Ichthyophthirius multifiliis]|uniref:P-loop containing nucleoside triphosphate hydrolase n=1 Tax=Ichthyophthirius multifiliis TaxID=5932 RepID=G0R2S8_ICHMU|nr:hypothetical protein IMG5_181290 [Ichthyophthirius multifiliis]EGR28200.1 hypothetical protein IMG5_181290 [Ichthyophthirius multifiliis]|eukprot:XP_004027545.1 hypothetical protein IMG5_181290 [Ichthyophthirius multifiliis]
MYQSILTNRTFGDNSKLQFNNVLMQLRKICCHPYLFGEAEDKNEPEYGEHIIENSGKLKILDKLLKKLYSEKKQKHQVLIFSQFTTVLDILEDYCTYREFSYSRIDGQTDLENRNLEIDQFQKKDSKQFIFLLSTRAGGLGINLTNANFVIIFDSDFNPQIDQQAVDRAYRIGQTRDVIVIRMITQFTVEEKIIERQVIKQKWNQLVSQAGKINQLNEKKDQGYDIENIRNIISYGADEIFKAKNIGVNDEDIDTLLQKGEEKAQEIQNKFSQFETNEDEILDFDIKTIQYKEFMGQEAREVDEIAIRDAALQNKELQKKSNARRKNNDQQYQYVNVKPVIIEDFQLFVDKERVAYLLQKQEEFKANGISPQDEEMYNEEYLEEITQYQGLSQDEFNELNSLLYEGFINWKKKDFTAFVNGCVQFGKNDIESIQKNFLKDKSIEEIQKYSKRFWEIGHLCINNFNQIKIKINKIQNDKDRLQKLEDLVQYIYILIVFFYIYAFFQIKQKFKQNPKFSEDIKFKKIIQKKYMNDNIFDQCFYKFLIKKVNQYGCSAVQKIMNDIQEDSLFAFNIQLKVQKEYVISGKINILNTLLKGNSYFIDDNTIQDENKQITDTKSISSMSDIQENETDVQEQQQEYDQEQEQKQEQEQAQLQKQNQDQDQEKEQEQEQEHEQEQKQQQQQEKQKNKKPQKQLSIDQSFQKQKLYVQRKSLRLKGEDINKKLVQI